MVAATASRVGADKPGENEDYVNSRNLAAAAVSVVSFDRQQDALRKLNAASVTHPTSAAPSTALVLVERTTPLCQGSNRLVDPSDSRRVACAACGAVVSVIALGTRHGRVFLTAHHRAEVV